MLEKMDLLTNPCTNFFLFTCGNHQKRKEEKLPNLYQILAEQANVEVEKIFSEPETPTDTNLLKTMKNAYKGCLSGGMIGKAKCAVTMLP